nr:MAG TPA: hypothetical protein [Bacteriophage sp.]
MPFYQKRPCGLFPGSSVKSFKGFVFLFQPAEGLTDALEPEAILAGPLFFLQFPDFFHPAFQDVPPCALQHFVVVFFESRHRKILAFMCFFLWGLSPLSCIYITLKAHNSKSFFGYLCILLDNFPFIGAGYQSEAAARVPLHVDGSGIIDVLNRAFGTCRRCLHIIHKDQPYPCALRPCPAFRQPFPQDGKVETELAVIPFHVLVIPIARFPKSPLLMHDIHQTADCVAVRFDRDCFLIVEPRESFICIKPPFICCRNAPEDDRHEGIRLFLDSGVASGQGAFEKQLIPIYLSCPRKGGIGTPLCHLRFTHVAAVGNVDFFIHRSHPF